MPARRPSMRTGASDVRWPFFAESLHTAKRLPCASLRLVRRQPVPFTVACFHLQMEGHFIVHVAVQLPAAHDGAEPSKESGDHRPAPWRTRSIAPEYSRHALDSRASAFFPDAESW